MRNVNFVEVGMENFGPYTERMLLMFENNSLTLLTGPNGIGKTMALDALPFTLFGTTSKGARGDDVVNNVVGRNCHTWVQFYINKDIYLVDRYHKYTKLGNTVTISKNGADPYKKGQREVLPEVERLLCPMKSFMNTLMFGQKIKDFFTDLIDSDKKEIFRKILDLGRYQLFYDRAKEMVENLKGDIVNLQNKMSVCEELTKDTTTQLVMLSEQKKEFYINLDTDIRDLEQVIETNNRLLEQWKDKLNELKKRQENWEHIESALLEFEAQEEKIESHINEQIKHLESQKDLKLEQLKTEAAQAKEKIKDETHEGKETKRNYFMTIHQKLISEADKLTKIEKEIDLEINTLDSSVDNAQLIIDDLESGMTESTCPTCFQTITDECKASLENKIIEIKDQMDEDLETIKDDLLPRRKEIHEQFKVLNKKKQQAQEIMEVDVADQDLFEEQKIIDADKKLSDAMEKVDHLFQEHKKAIKENFQDQLNENYLNNCLLPYKVFYYLYLTLQLKYHYSISTYIDFQQF